VNPDHLLTSPAQCLARSLACAAVALAMLCASPAASGAKAESGGTFDPDRLTWTEAQLSASKFFVSMSVSLNIERLDRHRAASLLTAPPQSVPIEAGPEFVVLSYLTDGLGRRNDVELLVDAHSGAALQRTSLETGSRHKHRVYRLRDADVLRITDKPLEGEESLDFTGWSRHSEEIYAYPDRTPGEPVTEAGALIYLAAASSLSLPGDSLRILALASDEFYEVEVARAGDNPIGVDYVVQAAGGTTRRTEKIPAVRLLIRGRPIGDTDDSDFRLLGLQDIELFVDPRTRAPLQLRGSVEVFGQVKFQLDSLTMRD
jgi:hypothetical protein